MLRLDVYHFVNYVSVQPFVVVCSLICLSWFRRFVGFPSLLLVFVWFSLLWTVELLILEFCIFDLWISLVVSGAAKECLCRAVAFGFENLCPLPVTTTERITENQSLGGHGCGTLKDQYLKTKL
jgi:hypothetical protein